VEKMSLKRKKEKKAGNNEQTSTVCGCTHTSHMQVLCVHRAAHLSELLSVDFIIPPHFLSCVEHSVVIPIIPFPRAFSHPRPSLWDSSAVYTLSFSDGDLNRLN